MKKRFMSIVAGVCAVVLLGGCAGSGELSNNNIKINKYKGLEIEKVVELPVTDEDVELSIKTDLESLATKTEITDRPAQMGDVATIDFEGKRDGVAFEGGSSTGYPLELGSGQFIKGFEEGVVGHNIGQTFDLNLTFPKDYGNPEMAGVAVVFTVTIKKLEEKHVPQLTEDILSELNTTAKTIDEYKAQVRKDLEVSNKASAETELQNAVWEELVKQCKIKKFPKGMVEEYVSNLELQYSYTASRYGVEVDELFEAMGTTAKEMAKKYATQQLAIALIAEEEGLTIKEKEYEEGLKKFADQYGYDDVEKFENAYGKDTIRETLLQEKVGKFLVENCLQVESKTEKEDK